MPLSATKSAARRATLAGLGTAGTLVGAIAAVAVLTVGVVAFSSWPGSPAPVQRDPVALGTGQGTPLRALAVASASVGGTPGAAPSATAAPSPPAALPRPAADDPVVSSADSAGNAGNGGATTTAAASPGSTTPQSAVSSPLEPVVAAPGAGADALGDTIKTGGDQAASVARPVSGSLANAVSSTTAAVGDTVAAAGQVVSDLLRSILPPPGP